MKYHSKHLVSNIVTLKSLFALENLTTVNILGGIPYQEI